MKKLITLSVCLIIATLALTSCEALLGAIGGHTHSFGEWEVTKAATCTEGGEKVRYCSCGDKQIEVIAALGGDHSFGEWETVKEATALEAGEKSRTCSKCGTKETGVIEISGEITVEEFKTVLNQLSENYTNYLANGGYVTAIPEGNLYAIGPDELYLKYKSDSSETWLCEIDGQYVMIALTVAVDGTTFGHYRTLTEEEAKVNIKNVLDFLNFAKNINFEIGDNAPQSIEVKQEGKETVYTLIFEGYTYTIKVVDGLMVELGGTDTGGTEHIMTIDYSKDSLIPTPPALEDLEEYPAVTPDEGSNMPNEE